MKKYLVVFVALLLVLTGCGKKKEEFKKPEKIGNEDNVVLVYEISNGSVAGAPTTETTVYKDKNMTIKHTNKMFEEENSEKTITLSEQDYQKIIDFAFSEDFMTLDKDLTSELTEGGSVYYITIYYDGTSHCVGGQNVKNETFDKLETIISECANK